MPKKSSPQKKSKSPRSSKIKGKIIEDIVAVKAQLVDARGNKSQPYTFIAQTSPIRYEAAMRFKSCTLICRNSKGEQRYFKRESSHVLTERQLESKLTRWAQRTANSLGTKHYKIYFDTRDDKKLEKQKVDNRAFDELMAMIDGRELPKQSPLESALATGEIQAVRRKKPSRTKDLEPFEEDEELL